MDYCYSNSQSLPAPAAQGFLNWGKIREENISAVEPEAKPKARIQGSHEDQERARDHQPQKAQRPSPIERERLAPAALK